MGAWPTDDLDNSNLDAGTDDPSAARADLNALLIKVQAILAARADASGVCDLDSGTKVPIARIPSLGVAQGGTGVTTVTVQGMLVGNGTSPLQVISPGTAGQILTSQGVGSVPNWTDQGFAVSVKAWFYQAAAPTGWSIDASTSDAVLGVGISTDVGGTLNGSWATDTDAHQLTVAESAAHAHAGSTANSVSSHVHGTVYGGVAGGLTARTTRTTTNYNTSFNVDTSSAGGHGHTLTIVSNGGDGSHVHNMSGWRPKRHAGIICVKV